MEATGRALRLGPPISATTFDLASYASGPAVRSDLPAWEYDGDYAVGVYNKPAVGLLTLERMVGSERFRAAMSAYLAEWRYRHPTAADFRAVLERELGELDWFFEDYIASEGQIAYVARLDQAVAVVERAGAVRAPVEVEVRYSDGERQRFTLTGDDERVELAAPAGKQPVAVVVDPDHKLFAELDRRDNGAYAAARPLPTMALGARLAFWLQTIVQTVGLFG
jgi:hypothetical protein